MIPCKHWFLSVAFATALFAPAFFAPGQALAGSELTPERVAQIEVGKTNQATIRSMFGLPQGRRRSEELEIWTYEQHQGTATRAAKGLLGNIADYFSPIRVPRVGGNSTGTQRRLMVSFDPRGTVREFAFDTN